MKVSYKVPGSCGEFIQGIIDGGEKLISMPVDIYSTVTFEQSEGNFDRYRSTKLGKAIISLLDMNNISTDKMDDINISVDSDLPIAKGMASSTADILGGIMCCVDYFNLILSKEDLVILCCGVEPTDSTIFSEISLFDHIRGIKIRGYELPSKLNVLILETEQCIDTVDFRKEDSTELKQRMRRELEQSLIIFEEGIKNGDRNLIGKACTISSKANQEVLYKPFLEEIIKVTAMAGGFGVNVAHSGCVIGVLYDEEIIDFDIFNQNLTRLGIYEKYNKSYTAKVISGGAVKLI